MLGTKSNRRVALMLGALLALVACGGNTGGGEEVETASVPADPGAAR